MDVISTDIIRNSNRARRTDARGFTLIEILVVLAITAVLFFLMLRPLLESLRLTQRAQLQAAAQDSARKTLEIISRELSSAVYVFDNASHPFVKAGATFASTDDHFTNFLDLDIPKKDGTTEVAHAYNAKLDIVPPRHTGSPDTTRVDPTSGEPIQVSGGIGAPVTIGNTGLQFPLAPGSSIIRYFIGLKDPTKPYTNGAERLGKGDVDNTYILYRVQVQVSNDIDPNTNKVITNPDLTTINEKLFVPKHDANGAVVNQPELDDPDFFRIVSNKDVDWLNSNHASFDAGGAETVQHHNDRVAEWYKLAKPVITAPNIDLLLLPREADGTVAFDATGAPKLNSTNDPVAGGTYPTVATSINFKPATLSADAAPGTTSDYTAAGLPQDAVDTDGLPYIPSVYTATAQSWGYPYRISLYPVKIDPLVSGSVPRYLNTTLYMYTDIDSLGSGDIVEYAVTGSPQVRTKVYDVTTNSPAAGKHKYVPMLVNPDTGTINFAVPALPDTTVPLDRYYTVAVNKLNTPAIGVQPGFIDLTDSAVFSNVVPGGLNIPLEPNGGPTTGNQVVNAHLVPGSVRVYGPDASPGPNQGNSILYQQIAPGAVLGYNQYRVDYLNSTIQLFVDAAHQLPIYQGDNIAAAKEQYVRIAYDFQANLAPVRRSELDGDTGTAITLDPSSNATPPGDNPAQPMLVKVDYQTRDLLDINIGVRVYDPTNGQAFTVPVSNRVKVNNSNR